MTETQHPTATAATTATTAQDAWPTQIRLPGQTAAHPGPVDMRMMYVMHHAFRRDLAVLAAAAAVTPAPDRRAWVALADRWALFAEALHHHHGGEDRGLWPRLLEVATVEETEVLEAMEAEHEGIDPMLAACGAGFDRLREHADEDARATLAVRLAAARAELGEHLKHEETEAIAIIQRHLTDAEWRAIEEEHFKAKLPLRTLLSLVPWVVEGVPAALRDDFFAEPGGRTHQVMWVLTRGRFRRHQRRALAHLTGPVEVR
ncbi:hemerythrin domain-containing protein [Nocardioides sp.]|uniref:hemerythrin domain-containing protein n=1 Tax=Nocardioides sp. TaxID=35761 RepID=UPI001A24EBCE|nr:hemerythrin domain-containing protein [Nocardioides sp.]MBJ7358657.1 hemerythrin domain-containing protein [Nocardioides sp.]